MMKDDEKRFLKIMQEQAWRAGQTEGFTMPRRIIESLDWLPEKRAHYLLEKWVGKGWYDYGTVIDGGWMTEEGMKAIAS